MRFYVHGGAADNQVLGLALTGTGNLGIGGGIPQPTRLRWRAMLQRREREAGRLTLTSASRQTSAVSTMQSHPKFGAAREV
jgi:hypothetical protein